MLGQLWYWWPISIAVYTRNCFDYLVNFMISHKRVPCKPTKTKSLLILSYVCILNFDNFREENTSQIWARCYDDCCHAGVAIGNMIEYVWHDYHVCHNHHYHVLSYHSLPHMNNKYTLRIFGDDFVQWKFVDGLGKVMKMFCWIE